MGGDQNGDTYHGMDYGLGVGSAKARRRTTENGEYCGDYGKEYCGLRCERRRILRRRWRGLHHGRWRVLRRGWRGVRQGWWQVLRRGLQDGGEDDAARFEDNACIPAAGSFGLLCFRWFRTGIEVRRATKTLHILHKFLKDNSLHRESMQKYSVFELKNTN